MCGSGRGVCGEQNLPSQILSILMIRATDARTEIHRGGHSVCCGAARSTTPPGTCGVPFASGTARTVGTGSSGFGWWWSHAVDPLSSVPLVSGAVQRGSPHLQGSCQFSPTAFRYSFASLASQRSLVHPSRVTVPYGESIWLRHPGSTPIQPLIAFQRET